MQNNKNTSSLLGELKINDETDEIKRLIAEKKIEAEGLSAKLLELQWKITRTEFIAYYENSERDEIRAKVQGLNDMIDSAEESWYGVDKQLREREGELKELEVERVELEKKLKVAKEKDERNQEMLRKLRQSVRALSNRNRALMLNLKKRKHDLDVQVRAHLELLDKN